jgi:hypothetical protein
MRRKERSREKVYSRTEESDVCVGPFVGLMVAEGERKIAKSSERNE